MPENVYLGYFCSERNQRHKATFRQQADAGLEGHMDGMAAMMDDISGRQHPSGTSVLYPAVY